MKKIVTSLFAGLKSAVANVVAKNKCTEKFKKDISKKIKYNSILKNSDHAILSSKENPKKYCLF